MDSAAIRSSNPSSIQLNRRPSLKSPGECSDAIAVRRFTTLTAVLTASVVALSCSTSDEGALAFDDGRSFCEVGELIIGSDYIVSYGSTTLLVNQPVSRRERCDTDLRPFPSDVLAKVDGVLFLDCSISWTDGGRSTAASEGISCDARPLDEQNTVAPPP